MSLSTLPFKITMRYLASTAFSRSSYLGFFGGAEGDRTPDLMTASHALSQLSYGPNVKLENCGQARVARGSNERQAGCFVRVG